MCGYRMPDDVRCPLDGMDQFEGNAAACLIHFPIAEKQHWLAARRERFLAAIRWLQERAEAEDRPLDLSGIQIPANFELDLGNRRSLKITDGIIEGRDRFAGRNFPGDLTLEGVHFPEGLSLADSTIQGRTRVYGLPGDTPLLNLNNCNFVGPAVIDYVHTRQITFDGARFRGDATLKELRATYGPISLRNACFDGALEARLRSESGIVGDGVSVTGNARLTLDARARTSLRGTTRFHGNVDFRGSVFRSELDCTDMQITGTAVFDRVRFGFLTLFTGCRFGGDANFTGADKETDTEGNSFHGISFRGAEFRGAANFINREFLGRADYTNCIFEVAPEFHGAKIHEAVVFPRQAFFHDTRSERAAAAYRTLKLRMESARSRNEEAMFFALEQRALRDIPGRMTWWQRLASYLYDKSSHYGQSFGLAFLWLVIAWAVFGIIYAVWESPPSRFCSPIDLKILGHGLTFSLAQVVNPFGVWRASQADLSAITAHWTPLLQWTATLQSVVCAGLAALVILALRWQFKRE